MINFDDVTKENMKEHNLNWQQILNLDLEKQIHYLIFQVSNQILIKFIYMLKIRMKRNINF